MRSLRSKSLAALVVLALSCSFAFTLSTAFALSAATAARSCSRLRSAALLGTLLRLPGTVAYHKADASLMSTDISMTTLVVAIHSCARPALKATTDAKTAPGREAVPRRIAPPGMIAAGTSITASMGLVRVS